MVRRVAARTAGGPVATARAPRAAGIASAPGASPARTAVAAAPRYVRVLFTRDGVPERTCGRLRALRLQ